VPTVWYTKHWGVNNAFRTKREAMAFVESHPHEVHHAPHTGEPAVTTEFETVYKGEIAAIVPCVTCKEAGRGETIVTAKEPRKYPYCKHCHYTGDAGTHMNRKTIDRINRLLPKGWESSVWHTGGGCMAVGISRTDVQGADHYLMTGGDFEVDTIGAEGVGSMGRQNEEGYGNTLFDEYDGDGKRITVEDAIKLIKADIKDPAPFTF
jgi:hypothetical protein